MKSAPPHALKGEVQANGYAQQWPYNAKLTVDGDLARLPAVLNGTLADGLANIHAVVKPLGRMPVENLHLRLADINLLRFTALGTLPESASTSTWTSTRSRARPNTGRGASRRATAGPARWRPTAFRCATCSRD